MEILDKDYVIEGQVDKSSVARTLAEVGYNNVGTVKEKFFVFSGTELVFVRRDYCDKRGKLGKTELLYYSTAEESGTHAKFDKEAEFNNAVELVKADSLRDAEMRNTNPKKEPEESDVCALYVVERNVFTNKDRSLPKMTIGELMDVRKPAKVTTVATLEDCDIDPKRYIFNALKATRSGLKVGDGIDIRAERSKKIVENVKKKFTDFDKTVQEENM